MLTKYNHTAAQILDRYLAARDRKRVADELGIPSVYWEARHACVAASNDVYDVLNGANGKPVFYRGYVWSLERSQAGWVLMPCLTPEQIKMEGE